MKPVSFVIPTSIDGFGDAHRNYQVTLDLKVKSSGKKLPWSMGWSDDGCEKILAKELFKSFDNFVTAPSTVGVSGGNVVIPSVRSSQSLRLERLSLCYQNRHDGTINGYHHSIVSDFLHSLFPSRFRSHYISLGNQSEHVDSNKRDDPREWTLTCYGKGDFFAPHSDGKKSERHFATLLLFPPAQGDQAITSFQGGDLILTAGQEKMTFIPSEFTEWTLVVFPIEMVHECTPVTEGRRFVFKTELELPPESPYFSNREKTEVRAKADMTSTLTRIDQEIQKYQHKIDQLREDKTAILENRLTERVKNMMEQIGDQDIIVLSTTDITTDPRNLEGEEGQLWNEIVKKFPYSTLQTAKAESDRGDGTGASDELRFEDEEINSYHHGEVHYWKSPADQVPGQHEGTETRYNDNTYDTIDKITVVIICVQARPGDGNSEDDDESNDEVNEDE